MSARYAATTEVPAERTRAEIEATLRRYGHTDAFAYGREGDCEILGFRLYGRYVRFTVFQPTSQDRVVAYTPGGKCRPPGPAIEAAIAAEHRRRWRVLLLQIKAKLEMVEMEVDERARQAAAEREFMGNLLLPDGRTMAEFIQPQLDVIYGQGAMPSLLPGVRPHDLPALGEGRP